LDTDEKINAIYDNIVQLDSIFKRKTYEEIKNLLDVHFLGKEATPSSVHNDEDDGFKLDEVASHQDVVDTTSKIDSPSDEDQRIKDILKDL
jgi:hypothetical protein